MNYYRLNGLTLATDRRLPELPPAAAPPGPVWTVRTRRHAAAHARWFQHRNFPDGRRWMSIGRVPHGYVVRFWRLAAFEIVPGDRLIVSRPDPAVPAATIRHLLLDQVVPLIASAPHRMALHASAVVSESGAVAFVGSAGRGKSTVAALLAQSGWPVLADDCLVLERRGGALLAVPSYPGLRLWPDAAGALFSRGHDFARVAHYSTKRRVGPPALPWRGRAVPLRRIYVLAGRPPTGGVRIAISPRTRREALFDLLAFAFCLDVEDRVRMGHVFDLAGQIAKTTPVRDLALARGLSRLNGLRAAVDADLGTMWRVGIDQIVAPSTEHPSTGHLAPSTGHLAPSTGHLAPSTGHL